MRRGGKVSGAEPAALATGLRTFLRRPQKDDEAEFTRLARASRRLHRTFARPPDDATSFRAWLARGEQPNVQIHLLCRREDGVIAGVLNLSEIVRGPLQVANLGYYAFAPHAGQGYMTEGLALALRHAFRNLGLHRLEANIQPGNHASRALVRGLGFQKEGFSPRYLKIGGRWRDHERWAIVRERWSPGRLAPASRARQGRR